MKKKKDKSVFLEYFGDTPQLRILDFLIENHFFDYPMTEIAKESNVGYHSFQKIFPIFIKSKILIKTRRIGKSDYYQLNIKHPFTKQLLPVYWSLIKGEILKDEIPITKDNYK